MDGGFGGNTVVLKFVGFDRLSSFSFLIGGFYGVSSKHQFCVFTWATASFGADWQKQNTSADDASL